MQECYDEYLALDQALRGQSDIKEEESELEELIKLEPATF